MPKRIKIPRYVKKESVEALGKRSKLNISNENQRKKGILSGLNYANKIRNNKYLDERDLKAIGKFYKLHKNKKGYALGIKLRGGAKFSSLMAKIYF